MGRTRRKRKRNIKCREDNSDLIHLFKWMKLKTRLKIKYFKQTGRGICCKQKIEPGDVLISLPLHLMITPENINESLRCMKKKLLPHLTLTILLMYERHLGESSKYYRYIKILPSSYSTLFFCNDNEVDQLPNFMREEFLRFKKNLQDHYENISITYTSKPCPHCGINLDKIFEYSSFTWAWFTVNTRCVYYKDQVQDTLALAPLLDMFNHSSDAANEIIIDHEKKLYILKTLKPCRKMQEICIKYGPHSNQKLVTEYGFVSENNPHDFIEFTFDEVLESLKAYKSEYGNITDKKYKFILRNKLNKNLTKNLDEFSWNVCALLYVIATRDENLSVINAKCYSNEFNEFECNEIKAVTEIMKETKKLELSRVLRRMRLIDEPSPSFRLAQRLVEIYINLLE